MPSVVDNDAERFPVPSSALLGNEMACGPRSRMQSESIQTFFSMIERLPDLAMVGGVVLLAILAAVWIHRLFLRMASRALRDANSFLLLLLEKTAGPSRLAFILLGVSAVLPLAPGLGEVLGKALMVAVIGLMGWVAMNAAEIGVEHYWKVPDGDAAENVMTRTHVTQVRVLKRCVDTVIILITAAFALLMFEAVRPVGISLLASAALAALLAAFAARPVLANLAAGVQLAMTQPIRIGDTIDIGGNTGTIEEITFSSVVMRLVDQRQQIAPLSHFTEKPFQNLTGEGSEIIGTVSVHTDASAPVERMRQKLSEIVENNSLWDGKVATLQVTEFREGRLGLRASISADTLRKAWDLRCAVREKLVTFLQREHPEALPVPNPPQPQNATGNWRGPPRITAARTQAARTQIVYGRPLQSNRALPSFEERWRASVIARTREIFVQARVRARAFFTYWSAKFRRSRKSHIGRGVPR
jgi:small-conductance mechanosensitive channel